MDRFVPFYKNRKKFLHRSGGILLLIKQEIVSAVTIYENKDQMDNIDKDMKRFYKPVNHPLCDHAIFFKLDKAILGDDILFCAMYLEPVGSKYINRDVLNEIENSLAFINIDFMCLMGDANSRTGALEDTLPPSIEEENDINFERCEIPKRSSMDSMITKAGRDLIDFCMTCDVVIVNGRLGKDAGVGKLTCTDASVVDYALVTPNLFSKITDFEVLAFDGIISDIHNGIVLTFSLKDCIEKTSQEPNIPDVKDLVARPRWKPDSHFPYLNNLNNESIEEIREALMILENHPEHTNLLQIDEVVGKINNVLISSATKIKVFTPSRQNKNPRKKKVPPKSNKPWFTSECKYAKEHYFKTKNKINSTTDMFLIFQKKEAMKEYKRCVKRQYRKYQSDRCTKIRMLKTNEPKEYWKLINPNSHKPDPNTPSCDDFYIFFQNYEQR